jgi:type I restriction enzyme S subunit
MHRAIRISEFLHRKKEFVRIDPEQEYRLVTVKLHHKGVVLRERKKGSLIGSNMYRLSKGQFILSGIDARNGAFGIVPDELDGAVVTNDFWYFDVDETKVKRDFFFWLTNTPLFLDACIKSSKGETQRVRLQKDLFFNFEFHFPSIEVQETFLKGIQSTDSLLSLLNQEQDKQTTYLSRLRQTILQEAIEGKLTADWRTKHPVCKGDPNTDAAALLDKIKTEKQKLIDEGKIKKEKPITSIKLDEIPFDLPEGWVWCRLGLAFNFIDYRGKTPHKTNEGVRIITAKNIRMGYIDENPIEYVTRELYEKWMTRGYPKNGDILIVTEGHTMGFAAIINKAYIFALAQRTIDLQPYFASYSRWSLYLILSSFFQKRFKNKATGAAATGIKSSNLKLLLIYLPPIAEQEAIVERVDRLLAIVDELEKQVAERKVQAEELMQAVLREAFEGKSG